MHRKINWASLGADHLRKLFKQTECLYTRTALETCHAVTSDIEKGIVHCLKSRQSAQLLPLSPQLKERAQK